MDAATIDRFVGGYLARSGLPGAAVAIVHGGQIAVARGYGRDSDGRPVTAATRMPIASLSKAMTAVAVLQLVEAGKINLDGPARGYLPDFTLSDPRAGQITVRELLNQTSGLSDRTNPPMHAGIDSLSQVLPSLRGARLAGPPGATWHYHNPNYQIAARLVEVVSGEPFGRYLRRHVAEPLGMMHTVEADLPRDFTGVAKGYVDVYGRSVAVGEPSWLLAGSGGVVTTADDMARWLTFNLTGRTVGPTPPILSTSDLALTQTPGGPAARYGMGWGTSPPTVTPRRIGHNGALFTFTAYAMLLPDTGYGIAVLANRGLTLSSESDADLIGHGLVALAGGTAPHMPRPPALALDSLLALLTLGSAAAACTTLARGGRWARRHQHDAVWSLAIRLAPLALPALVLAGLPRLARELSGRDLALRQLAYLSPALVFGLGIAAALAATVTAVRLVTLRNVKAAR